MKAVIAINRGEITGKVHNSMYQQWKRRGYAAPVDTLIDCGILYKKSYEEWRYGKVLYLEKCCTVNLKMLSYILHEMRAFAEKNNWKASFCYYKRWGLKKKNGQGHKPVIPLRFSKSGSVDIEKQYSTHFVDAEQIKKLKQDKAPL